MRLPWLRAPAPHPEVTSTRLTGLIYAGRIGHVCDPPGLLDEHADREGNYGVRLLFDVFGLTVIGPGATWVCPTCSATFRLREEGEGDLATAAWAQVTPAAQGAH
jgi:hypothetical protein